MIDDLGELVGEAIGQGLSSGKKGCIIGAIVIIVLGIAGFLVWKYAL
jgi:hypothetical protein